MWVETSLQFLLPEEFNLLLRNLNMMLKVFFSPFFSSQKLYHSQR